MRYVYNERRKIMTELQVILSDARETGDGTDAVSVAVEKHNLGLGIKIEGYGCWDDDDAAPIFIERYDGVVRVLIWDNINQEDPSHIITLEGARHEERIEE
jgi:hypothetical protein